MTPPSNIYIEDIYSHQKICCSPLVSVVMMTFNHGKYIGEAIDSIIQQQTDFEFELLIGEDCSTDNTREIVRMYQQRYPGIIRLFLPQKNLGVWNNMVTLFKKMRAPFCAICEGDDYWSSPFKLQRQIDLFKRHPHLGFVYCDFDIENQINRSRITGVIAKHESEELRRNASTLSLEDVICGRCRIATCSFLGRSEVVLRSVTEDDEWKRQMSLGDLFFKIESAAAGEIGFVPESLVTYRMINGSATHTGSAVRALKFEFDVLQIRTYYAEKYGLSEIAKKNIYSTTFRRIVKLYLYIYDPEGVRRLREMASFHSVSFNYIQMAILFCSEHRILNFFIRKIISFLKFLRHFYQNSIPWHG